MPLSRDAALEIAKVRYAEFKQLDLDFIFGRGPEPDAAKFGFRHGWVSVDGHSFNHEHLTGEKYDITQGGWAFI